MPRPPSQAEPRAVHPADVGWLVRTGRITLLLVLPLLVIPPVAGAVIDGLVRLPQLGPMFDAVGLGAYNTRVVVLGTLLLGAASGVVGSFAVLRKRALMGDVLSHAMLPGIALAFIVMVLAGGDGKALAGLLAGAVVFGLLGLLAVLGIRSATPLKEDAALGIVLSVFFGLGVAVLGVVQKMKEGNAAGLESFIYGKTASMLLADARLVAIVGALACWYSAVLFKEFSLVCFDQDYAAAQGRPVALLDVLMLALLTAVAVIGLQAVGLILMVALLIIPAAAARFWTERLLVMVLVAAGIGGLSGAIGAGISAQAPKLPAGAIIVTVASGLFFISMLFGARRGTLRRLLEMWSLRRRIARQHLLRAMFERDERRRGPDEPAPGRPHAFADLLAARSWSALALRRLLRRLQREAMIERVADGTWRLTPAGRREAERITRNHRLWELYLITHADIAPSHVDRDADLVEHVLGQDLVQRLEALLARRARAIPESPHAMPGDTP